MSTKSRHIHMDSESNPWGLEPLEEAVLIELGHLPPRPFNTVEIGLIFGVSQQCVSEMLRRLLKQMRYKLRDWEGFEIERAA